MLCIIFESMVESLFDKHFVPQHLWSVTSDGQHRIFTTAFWTCVYVEQLPDVSEVMQGFRCINRCVLENCMEITLCHTRHPYLCHANRKLRVTSLVGLLSLLRHRWNVRPPEK